MVQPQYLVLLRHARSEANDGLHTSADGLYYSRSGSDRSVPLTLFGKKQARDRGKELARMFPRSRKLSRLFHTDFKRVADTARLIQAELPYKVKAVVDPRLNKRSYGRFWNLTREGVAALHPEEWQRYSQEGDLHYRAPDGGENYFDMFARIDNFVDTTLSTARGHIAVVTHSAPMLAFLRKLEGLSEAEVHRKYEATELPNAHAIVFWRLSPQYDWRRTSAQEVFDDQSNKAIRSGSAA